VLSPSSFGLTFHSTVVTEPPPPPLRIAAFVAFYGHVDYYGFLYRKRKRTNRWLREFLILVDSELHYFASANDDVAAPFGTIYVRRGTVAAAQQRADDGTDAECARDIDARRVRRLH
jgi:hypothetical protein